MVQLDTFDLGVLNSDKRLSPTLNPGKGATSKIINGVCGPNHEDPPTIHIKTKTIPFHIIWHIDIPYRYNLQSQKWSGENRILRKIV